MNLGGPFIDLMLGERPRNAGPSSRQDHELVALIFLKTSESGPAQAALVEPLAPFPGPAVLFKGRGFHARVPRLEDPKEGGLDGLLGLLQPRKVQVG
jgi:hypothetical protein